MTFRADAGTYSEPSRRVCTASAIFERRSPQRVPAMLVVAVARALRSARSWLRHRAFGSAFFRSRQTTGIAGINRAAHRGGRPMRVETLRRLKNGGSQIVRVEHVHVN